MPERRESQRVSGVAVKDLVSSSKVLSRAFTPEPDSRGRRPSWSWFGRQRPPWPLPPSAAPCTEILRFPRGCVPRKQERRTRVRPRVGVIYAGGRAVGTGLALGTDCDGPFSLLRCHNQFNFHPKPQRSVLLLSQFVGERTKTHRI